MLSKQQYTSAKEKALGYFEKAYITITAEEKEKIEVADFGIGALETIGFELLTDDNIQRTTKIEEER